MNYNKKTKNTEYCVGTYYGNPVEVYQPSKEDVIAMRYNFGELPCDILQKQYEMLKNIFRDNPVIILPNNLWLEKLSRDNLIQLRNKLDELILDK